MSELPSKEVLYEIVCRRDASYAGAFIVAVKTTRIMCRPGCPARVPHLKNIEFFKRAGDALHAGYRPCKRCRPLDNLDERPKFVDDLLNHLEQNDGRRVQDAELRRLGNVPETVRRAFKRQFGMTFHAYSRALRMGNALHEIRNGKNAIEVAMDLGYESDSAFRDAFESVFNTTVGNSSTIEPLMAKWLDSPLGALLILANESGVCLLEFVDRRMLMTQLKRVRLRFGAPVIPGNNTHIEQLERELQEYFSGERKSFDTHIVYPGTDFQVRVWNRLLDIPYGKTISYGELAHDIGATGGSRAVGRANGDNRIAILIPCHRVIHADGTLCGYGGGLWRKQWLLELESGTAQKSLFSESESFRS